MRSFLRAVRQNTLPQVHMGLALCVVIAACSESTETSESPQGDDSELLADGVAGSTSDVADELEVIEAVLLIEACVIAGSDDCVDELVIDAGALAPGAGLEGAVHLTNVGTSVAMLTEIAWQLGGQATDSELLTATPLGAGQPIELPAAIDSDSTLITEVRVLPGVAPGSLIELVTPVCGLNDAPASFQKELIVSLKT